MGNIELRNCDAFELLRGLPDGSVDLVLTDPPYNIGKNKAWDRIDNYVEWCGAWLSECQRVLRDNGQLIFWHNDMQQVAELMSWIGGHLSFVFNSFCFWHKPNYRKTSWENSGGGIIPAQLVQRVRVLPGLHKAFRREPVEADGA